MRPTVLGLGVLLLGCSGNGGDGAGKCGGTEESACTAGSGAGGEAGMPGGGSTAQSPMTDGGSEGVETGGMTGAGGDDCVTQATRDYCQIIHGGHCKPPAITIDQCLEYSVPSVARAILVETGYGARMQLDQKSLMLRAIDLALTFDRPSLLAAHRAFLAKYPQESREHLALRLVSRSAWRALASGVVTGLPSSPWVALPAALADTAAMIRIEAYVAARVALLFDEHYFEGEDLRHELMLPVMGGYVASAPVGEPADHGKASVTRRILRNLLSKESLRQLKGMMLKYFGAKVTQRALVTKTLPLVGGVLGGAWNYVELRMVGQRSYAYFAAAAAAK